MLLVQNKYSYIILMFHNSDARGESTQPVKTEELAIATVAISARVIIKKVGRRRMDREGKEGEKVALSPPLSLHHPQETLTHFTFWEGD